MTAKFRPDLSDSNRRVIQAGPWYVSINTKGQCQATSGDYWFPVSRQEARELILRKKG